MLDIIFYFKFILVIFNWKDLVLKGLKILVGYWMGVCFGIGEKVCMDY